MALAFLVTAIVIGTGAGLLRGGRLSPSPIRTIAVLPFKPLVLETRDEALELGMAETLVARLSTIKDIAVRPLRCAGTAARSRTL